MTFPFKKPAVVAKTARKVKLTANEVAIASVPLTTLAKAKLPKRGRPVDTKNKPAASKVFKQSDADAAIHSLVDANLKLIGDNNQLLRVIENLEHQIIGFRAVVSYLESQAGLKVTQ